MMVCFLFLTSFLSVSLLSRTVNFVYFIFPILFPPSFQLLVAVVVVVATCVCVCAHKDSCVIVNWHVETRFSTCFFLISFISEQSG